MDITAPEFHYTKLLRRTKMKQVKSKSYPFYVVTVFNKDGHTEQIETRMHSMKNANSKYQTAKKLNDFNNYALEFLKAYTLQDITQKVIGDLPEVTIGGSVYFYGNGHLHITEILSDESKSFFVDNNGYRDVLTMCY